MARAQGNRRRRYGMLIGALVALFCVLLLGRGLFQLCFVMPGESWRGALPAPDAATRQLAERLRGHVEVLAGDIGERNHQQPAALAAAADYVFRRFEEMGYVPSRQVFGEQRFSNVVVDLYGSDRTAGVLVIGAHYDTAWLTPGADDNASGVAGLLEVARLLHGTAPRQTLRFIAFANEERPFFGTANMGSYVAAARSAALGERINGMFSLEMIGYYDAAPGSQVYPRIIRHLYPTRADFIAFVGNLRSRGLLHRSIALFRAHAGFPSEGLAAPELLVPDIRRSDNVSYWGFGYPALMVTDTANFRNIGYHNVGDVPRTLDYPRMARVVAGLAQVFARLAAEAD